MNQHEKIHAFMMRNGSITPMDAFSVLGITKLATRIGEMIRGGASIRKRMVIRRTEEGSVRYMQYTLGD